MNKIVEVILIKVSSPKEVKENLVDSNSLTQKQNIEYTTTQLLDDLMLEIEKSSETLTIRFPERLTRYGAERLSKLWGHYAGYLASAKQLFKKDSTYRISDVELSNLESKLIDKYGPKALKCQEIMSDYKNSKIDLSTFILQMCVELARISGEVELTYIEFKELFGFNVKKFKSDIKQAMKEGKNKRLSLEQIDDIIDEIDIMFKERADNCRKLIEKYTELNSGLKEYPKQSHNVGLPHYFEEILSGQDEKAYLFGFLCSDGFKEQEHKVGININEKDIKILYKFANAIKLDLDKCKIEHRKIEFIYKGELRTYYQARLRVGCLPTIDDLNNLKFSSSKADLKEVPPAIIALIEQAKLENFELWFETKAGKTALAWLLGYFDGDGSYSGWTSGQIYCGNREFLNNIKELFEIKKEIKTHTEPGTERLTFDDNIYISKGYYYLSLDRETLLRMWNSYSDSFNRKRPTEAQWEKI